MSGFDGKNSDRYFMRSHMRRKQKVLSLVPFLSLCLVIGVQHAAVAGETDFVAKLEASRLSGPAPLAVMFDATGTAMPAPTDAFREVTYDFDFGDDRGLKWVHSGQPRNRQTGGPLAAHVYDLPGTYTVRLRATAPDGKTSDASLVVTVEDPDKVYAGERTVCVSPSGQFAGCPAKAVRDTRLPVTYGGSRVLLHRGEVFEAVSIDRNSDGIVVGSYGTGAKPVVERVFVNAGRFNDKSTDDLTIMDLAISDGLLHSGTGSRYLIYRNELTRPGGNNTVELAGALDYLAEHNPKMRFYNPREMFIVDNVVRGQVNTSGRPHNNLSGVAAYIAIMGNDLSRSQEHTMRLGAVHKGFIAHNALRGISHGGPPDGTGISIRSTMKINAGGLRPYNDDWSATRGKWATNHLIIADNLMGDPENNGSFTAGVSPQNRDAATTEGIEDVIIERNRFIRGPHTNTEMENFGRRITTRHNSRMDGQRPNLSIGQPSPSLPSEWHGPVFRE